MRAVILIAWRPGGDDRRRQLWDWTRAFLEEIGWPIVTADAPGEVFSRARALNVAARAAGKWDVALIGDADTVQDVDAAHRTLARTPEVGLVIPWTHRIKLSQEGTLKLVRGGPGAVTYHDRDPRDTTAPWGGGATLMVSRAAFQAVGGFDERFEGYGNEDLAFHAAVETLVVGAGAPHEAGLVWHLWHRPARMVGTKRAATRPNRELWDRYKAVRWNPEGMRALLKQRT